MGGVFAAVDGFERYSVARLNPDGTLDLGFAPTPGAQVSDSPGLVRTLSLQANGKVIVGGYFERFNNALKSYVARLNPDGSLDESFDGVPRPALVRLHGDSRPRLLALDRLPDGQLNLTTSARALHTYRLETSIDLQRWTPFVSVTAQSNTVTFPNLPRPVTSSLFFRVVKP